MGLFSPHTEEEIKKIAKQQFFHCMFWFVFIPGAIGFLIGYLF